MSGTVPSSGAGHESAGWGGSRRGKISPLVQPNRMVHDPYYLAVTPNDGVPLMAHSAGARHDPRRTPWRWPPLILQVGVHAEQISHG